MNLFFGFTGKPHILSPADFADVHRKNNLLIRQNLRNRFKKITPMQKLISHRNTEITEEIKVFPCFSCFRGKHNA